MPVANNISLLFAGELQMPSSDFDCVFCVKDSMRMPDWSHRVGALHYYVYHGKATRPETDRQYHEWHLMDEKPPFDSLPPHPGVTNTNRERLHVVRSGAFVPPVFIPNFQEFIVSKDVFERASKLPNIEGLPVYFERLVDLPMPALGDFSWYDRAVRPYRDPDPRHEFEIRDNIPALHTRIGIRYELLGSTYHDLKNEYEFVDAPLDFGNYCGSAPNQTEKLSWKAMEKYPLIGSLMRPDLFSILAPHLDLDHFSIAIIYR